MIQATVLADSLSPAGVRLTTVQAEFPRWMLAEVHTHRLQGPWNTGAQSSNSASSRAIPPERIIERVIKDPYVPQSFGGRVKGMGVGEALPNEDQLAAQKAWLYARDRAVQAAQVLISLNCDKSRINRLLEPFMWHTAIITATDWDNFFWLRAPEGEEWDRNFPAQPEFQMLAIDIRQRMRESTPQELEPGWWHLPFAREEELEELCARRATGTHNLFEENLLRVCGRRLARVSFDKHTDSEEFSISIGKGGELIASRHYSPFEHMARPVTRSDMEDPDLRKHLMVTLDDIYQSYFGDSGTWADDDNPPIESRVWSGNLRGFIQYRKLIEETPWKDDERDKYAAAL